MDREPENNGNKTENNANLFHLDDFRKGKDRKKIGRSGKKEKDVPAERPSKAAGEREEPEELEKYLEVMGDFKEKCI